MVSWAQPFAGGVAADAVQTVLHPGLNSALLRAAWRALYLFYSSGEMGEVCLPPGVLWSCIDVCMLL